MTTSLDELLRVLREQAATLEDDIEADWSLDVNSVATRLKASARTRAADPDSAFEDAKNLRDAVTALGFELHSNCKIGASAEANFKDDPESEGPSMPFKGWRGRIELVFDTP